MLVKFNLSVEKVVVLTLISLILGASQGLTADWQSILKQAKTKYAKFEKEVKDMTIVREMTMTTSEGKMTSESKVFKKGKKFRIENTMQIPDMPSGMKTIIIYDGKETWMISPMRGKKKLSQEEQKQYQTGDWWDFLSEKGQLVGTEKVGKRDCYIVQIKEQKESPYTKVWLDKKDLVLVKAESKESKGETMLMVFSDFRKIKDKWEMPYMTEMYVDGKLASTILVKSLKTNTGLSDDLFDSDKVETPNMQEMMKKMMQQKQGE